MPIGHIEPPIGDNGLCLIYLQFTGQTTGYYQQNLIWSFAGKNDDTMEFNINDRSYATALNTGNGGEYRATSGSTEAEGWQNAKRRGGIFFMDENNDKFRGLAYRKSCNVRFANSNSYPEGNNRYSDGSRTYEMAHQVDVDTIYEFLCKNGAWFLRSTSHAGTGAVQKKAQGRIGNAEIWMANTTKTSRIIAGTQTAPPGSGFETTGSLTGVMRNLNMGGSFSYVNHKVGSYGEQDADGFIYMPNRDLSNDYTTTNSGDRQGLASVKITTVADTSAGAPRQFDVFNYILSEYSARTRLQAAQQANSEHHVYYWGDEHDADNIAIHPQSGSIQAVGGATSHSNLYYTRANAIAIASGTSETGVTIHPIVAGIANGKGFRMIRAGSVTGMSLQMDAANNSVGAGAPASLDCFVRVFKNGYTLVSGANINGVSSDGDKGAHSVFIPGTYEFAAGDTLQCGFYYTSVANGETQDIEHIAIMIEIQTNPTMNLPQSV